jgi:hypothetical protein
MRCYGSDGLFQGDCGSATPHGEHDFTDADRICMGAPAHVEADCGRPGPHGEHPMSEVPS